jgi:hypothetical protein
MAPFYARLEFSGQWTVDSEQWSGSVPKGRIVEGAEFRGLKASAPSAMNASRPYGTPKI